MTTRTFMELLDENLAPVLVAVDAIEVIGSPGIAVRKPGVLRLGLRNGMEVLVAGKFDELKADMKRIGLMEPWQRGGA